MKNASVNSIDANLRQVVYKSAIRNGEVKEWDFLWKKFLEERVDIERVRMMTPLSSAIDNFWDNLEENSGESFASLSEFAKELYETAKDEEKSPVM